MAEDKAQTSQNPVDDKKPGQGEARVLMLLEDDVSLRGLLQMMLAHWGFEVMTFIDGYRAAAWLDTVASGQFKGAMPRLALLDIRVPGPQGTEIAQRMRALPATAKIPIVIMTAYRISAIESDLILKDIHPDSFLQKSDLNFDALQAHLEELISRASPVKPPDAAAAEPVKAPASGQSPAAPGAEGSAKPPASEQLPNAAKPEEPVRQPVSEKPPAAEPVKDPAPEQSPAAPGAEGSSKPPASEQLPNTPKAEELIKQPVSEKPPVSPDAEEGTRKV